VIVKLEIRPDISMSGLFSAAGDRALCGEFAAFD
jgi:hypothetical protein